MICKWVSTYYIFPFNYNYIYFSGHDWCIGWKFGERLNFRHTMCHQKISPRTLTDLSIKWVISALFQFCNSMKYSWVHIFQFLFDFFLILFFSSHDNFEYFRRKWVVFHSVGFANFSQVSSPFLLSLGSIFDRESSNDP